jgi:hypothetical protein
MATIGSVIQLADESVGVVGDLIPGGFRLYFTESYLTITAADIVAELSAPTYSVNDSVAVWPYGGTITAIDGDEYTVQVSKSVNIPGLGVIDTSGPQVVPFWRLVRDNDSRIKRVWR